MSTKASLSPCFGWKPLSKQVGHMWQAVLFLAMALASLTTLFLPLLDLSLKGWLWLGLLLIWLFLALFYLPTAHRNFRYSLTPQHLLVRRGVFLKREQWLSRAHIVYLNRLDLPNLFATRFSVVVVVGSGAMILFPTLERGEAVTLEHFINHGQVDTDGEVTV